jgi:hypothetical protein
MHNIAKAVNVNEIQFLLDNMSKELPLNRYDLVCAAYVMIERLEKEKAQYPKRNKIALLDVFAQSNIKPPEDENEGLKVYCMNCGDVNFVYPSFIPTFHCTECCFENRLTKEQIKYLKSL